MRKYYLSGVFFSLLWVVPLSLCAQEKQPVWPVYPLKKNNPAYEASQLPHQDIERVDHPVVIAGHTGTRKHFSTPEFFAAPLISRQPGTSALALWMAAVSPAKNYLFHIYPSHNFW